MTQKYSLFQMEELFREASSYVGEFKVTVTRACFIYLETFDTLEEAQDNANHIKYKTLILSSY